MERMRDGGSGSGGREGATERRWDDEMERKGEEQVEPVFSERTAAVKKTVAGKDIPREGRRATGTLRLCGA